MARRDNLWDPHVCLTFGTQLLEFIKKNVTIDDRNTVYTIKYDAKSKAVHISQPVVGGPLVFIEDGML